MSALTTAEARMGTALARLEHALTEASDGHEERERLRRELSSANERADRLAAVLGEIEDRVDGAMDRVDELAGSRVTR
ncbi:MAG: hypothetical protein U1E52_16380 [Geminicoccaceae bacterium]